MVSVQMLLSSLFFYCAVTVPLKYFVQNPFITPDYTIPAVVLKILSLVLYGYEK